MSTSAPSVSRMGRWGRLRWVLVPALALGLLAPSL